jgi:pimeloyl-ACP methyl ester carboxylesterase
MADPLPTVFVPGLLCSARLYASQLSALWQFGPVTVADHRRDDTMDAIAARILAATPPRFALAGLSMGGYISFAMLRQAPKRIARLALLDTSARPDTAEQTASRKTQIVMAKEGRLAEVSDLSLPRFIHVKRQSDEPLKTIVRQMAQDTGAEGLVRQLTATMSRPDSRPLLSQIRCPAIVIVGDADVATPPELSREIAEGIKGASLRVITDCGHLSTLERPDAVNAALSDWLGGSW